MFFFSNKSILVVISSIFLVLLSGCASKEDLYVNMDASKIYEMGENFVLDNKYSKAEKAFTSLETKFPYGPYTEKAKLAKIYTLYKLDDPQDTGIALASCDRFISQYPKHKNVDYVYYMKGIINYDNNYTALYKIFNLDRGSRESEKASKAFGIFKQLLDKYPNSQYAYDAKMRMIQLREQIGGLEYLIAKFYFDDAAYASAANRAMNSINKCPQTEAARKSVVLLAKIAKKIQQPKLLAQVNQVIKANKITVK